MAAGSASAGPGGRTLYLQKAAFATSLMLLVQGLFGHRLPLVSGPSAALLLGVVGSPATPDAIFTAAAVWGVVLAAVSAGGLFGALRRLFSPRVTATMLLLIAFTLTPTLVHLLTADALTGTPGERLAFAAGHVLALLLAHRLLPPAGRSLLILGGLAAGTAAFAALFGTETSAASRPAVAWLLTGVVKPAFDPGALVSVFFCFLALSLNEVGSLQAIEALVRPDGMEARLRRGMAATGLLNGAAGFLGVIGPVDYSLSSGVVAATRCGSRHPLVAAGGMLLAASFSPALLGIAGAVPETVVAGILSYTLAGQVSVGLAAAFAGKTFAFDDGLVIGLPLLAGTVAAHLPPAALAGIPPGFRAVAGNGFVVGVVTVLIVDRLFRRPVEPLAGEDRRGRA